MFQIGIFAKFWEPGKVKTRLAAKLGEAEAADLYRQFVEALLERFRHEAARRVVAYWPPERLDPFRKIAGKDWQFEQQVAGDLGQRMAAYFRNAFAAGASGAALIGSDSPTLPADIFKQAHRELSSAEIVLGPTEDGGYYLIGLRRSIPELFQAIQWSSNQVFQQTVERLSRLGLRYATLPTWYDVDDWQDLLRLQKELNAYGGNDQQLLRLGPSVARAVQGAGDGE